MNRHPFTLARWLAILALAITAVLAASPPVREEHESRYNSSPAVTADTTDRVDEVAEDMIRAYQDDAIALTTSNFES